MFILFMIAIVAFDLGSGHSLLYTLGNVIFVLAGWWLILFVIYLYGRLRHGR